MRHAIRLCAAAGLLIGLAGPAFSGDMSGQGQGERYGDPSRQTGNPSGYQSDSQKRDGQSRFGGDVHGADQGYGSGTAGRDSERDDDKTMGGGTGRR